jgi:hypothetical protein
MDLLGRQFLRRHALPRINGTILLLLRLPTHLPQSVFRHPGM